MLGALEAEAGVGAYDNVGCFCDVCGRRGEREVGALIADETEDSGHGFVSW